MSLYEVLKASKTERFPDYWTLLWGRKLSAKMIKTLTGTLPLTFITNENHLRSWSIYGNDSIGKNLLNIESSTIALHMTIDSVDNSTGSIVLTAESGYTYRGTSVIITNLLEIGKTYEITLTKNNATPSEQLANATLRRVDTNTIVASVGTAGFAAAGDKTFLYTHTQKRAEQGIYFSLLVTGNCKTGGTVSVSNLMIREATTSATFEPYQIGVGQRTANLFDYATTERIYPSSLARANEWYKSASGTVLRIPCEPSTTYTVKTYITDTNFTYRISYTSSNDTPGSSQPATDVIKLSGKNIPEAQTFTTASNTKYILMQIYAGSGSTYSTIEAYNATMIVKGSTAPVNFITHGYEIPLTISHITDNLFDKNAHDTANGFIDNKKVYWDGLKQYSTIKDNNYFLSEYMPVTAGKGYYPTDIYYYDALKEYYSIFFYTADKQLIDVAYYSRETVTPAPENAAYMRVCVAKNKADSAMMTTKPTSEYIPHKQSIDYTIPIDAPLTEGQSVSDTQTIEVFEGENTIDTTLYNKPTMEIKYK